MIKRAMTGAVTAAMVAASALMGAPVAGAAKTPHQVGQVGPTATCSGEGRPGRVVVVRGMPTQTRQTARTLLARAVRCDAGALVKRATADGTRLSFGLVTPKEFFALPEQEVRYRYLVDTVARSRPGFEKVGGAYVWPRVATEAGTKDPRAWDEAVAAELLTRRQADRMRREGSGYLGWRLAVGESGAWHLFVAGD